MVEGLNILFTTADFPYPLIGGERIKQFYILKHLASNNNIFLVGLDHGYKITKDYLDELIKIGIKPFAFEVNHIKAYMNAALFSPLGHPMEIEFFRHKGYKNKIREILKSNKIDLTLTHFIRTAEFVKNLKTKKILFAEDCRSHYQERTYKVSNNLRQKLIRNYEYKKLRKYETEILNSFNITTLVTNEDVMQMKSLNPNADIRLLSNGVNQDIFVPPLDNKIRKDILFVGKLDCWANELIVDRIVNIIFPEIIKEKPNTRLHIVGANPKKKLFKIINDNIQIHADVTNIVPFLQKAALFLHPHVGGSGIQNKVLEAMSCGCPVVTTQSGARGIDIINGQNGFVADSKDEFVEYSLRLLDDSELRNQIGKNARNLAVSNHSWENIFNTLDDIIIDALNQ